MRHRYAKEIQPQRAHLTYVSDERWAVSVGDADPASTRSEQRRSRSWNDLIGRSPPRGSLELSGDAESFYLVIHITALHDDRIVFSRTWSDTVPREWA